MIQASICTIGDEILIGQIVDTNSSRIASALEGIGVRVTRMVSFGDDRKEILECLEEELRRNDIVVVTGGLGPTKDDITKSALAELSGSRMYVENSGQLGIIENILKSRGLDMLDINRAQAYVPDTCSVIPNRLGTAPVMIFRFGEEQYGHQCSLYSLPGVPFEAEGAIPDVLDDIKGHFRLEDIYHRSIMTFGIAESALSKKIADWEDSLPRDMHLAYLPNPLTGVRLRLSVYGGTREEESARIDRKFAELRQILGEAVYAGYDTTLQEVIGRMLKEKGRTVSAAESCTGGMISQLLASVPGASEYYLGSVTSYANSVKENVLGVPAETIEKNGAVSSECVARMAEGVRKLTGSDYSIATSGIAGPGGGSEDKPVGLVWVGVSSASGTRTCKFMFKGDRIRNMERFASSALNVLREKIMSDSNEEL